MFWTLRQNHSSKGVQMETMARQLLQSHGLELVQNNYACRFGEIDLIMLDQQTLVFIEVRYRSEKDFGNASESITRKKQQRLQKTALHFLQSHPEHKHRLCRFDAICLTSSQSSNDDARQKPIEWLKGVFQ